MRFPAALIAAMLLLAWPELAQACAVCFSARSDEAREAFRITAVFLTFLPLVGIGGLVWWLRRRARQLARAARIDLANARI